MVPRLATRAGPSGRTIAHAVVLAALGSAFGCGEPPPRATLDPPESNPTLPRSYDAPRALGALRIDGRLDESEWTRAPFTEAFVDIRGTDHAAPMWETRVRMLWDDQALYVGARLEEPHLWATLTTRDAIVWHDHDFEVFLDPDGDGRDYFELEINARGTELDLFLAKPYSEGGTGDIEWDIEGLVTAVWLDGTLGDATDVDQGWSVEIAIPWGALRPPGAASRPGPPAPGERWRVNFSRVQWPLHQTAAGGYERAAEPSFEVHHENNWVWSPQGEINMHIPDRWGWVRFVAADRSQGSIP